jgi:hypothetical protein
MRTPRKRHAPSSRPSGSRRPSRRGAASDTALAPLLGRGALCARGCGGGRRRDSLLRKRGSAAGRGEPSETVYSRAACRRRRRSRRHDTVSSGPNGRGSRPGDVPTPKWSTRWGGRQASSSAAVADSRPARLTHCSLPINSQASRNDLREIEPRPRRSKSRAADTPMPSKPEPACSQGANAALTRDKPGVDACCRRRKIPYEMGAGALPPRTRRSKL